MALAVVAKTGVEFDVANRVFFRLYQASNLPCTNRAPAMSARSGQRPSNGPSWAHLAHDPFVRDDGMMVKDLMEFLDVSRQNLEQPSSTGWEGRGWIKRVKDKDDGRSRLVRLTGEGNKIWTRMQEPIEAFSTPPP